MNTATTLWLMGLLLCFTGGLLSDANVKGIIALVLVSIGTSLIWLSGGDCLK